LDVLVPIFESEGLLEFHVSVVGHHLCGGIKEKSCALEMGSNFEILSEL